MRHPGRDDGIDNVLFDIDAKLIGRDVIVMLGGNHYRRDPPRDAVDIFDADLAFTVRPQIAEHAGAAHFAQAPHQLMGKHDWQRHELFGLVAGIAEHQALVSGAARVHTHGDVGRLRLNYVEHSTSGAIETHGGVGEANVTNHASN